MGANHASQVINISTFLEMSAAVFWFVFFRNYGQATRQVQCVQQTLYIIHEHEHFDCKL